jgi:hypothetical protein
MPTSRFERFLPIAGILAGLCFLASSLLTWGMPDITKADGHERVQWMTDHGAATTFSGFAAGYFCVLMVFFACALRSALRSGEPGESTYSSAAFAGGLVVALAVALMGWVTLAGTEAADHGQRQVVTTLAFLGDFGWIPWVAGSAVLFLATGLGGLRTASLPKPLAIVTVILGVLSLLGPAGIAVYFATPFWLVVTGVVLHRRRLAAASSVPVATASHRPVG